MKKYIFFIAILLVFLGCGIALYNISDNDEDLVNQTTNGSRISTNVTTENSKNKSSNNLSSVNESTEKNTNNIVEISSYSTIIKDNSPGRLTNISITCSILNNTIIKNGETFSFNEVIGNPTAERGYQEASIIIDHKTQKGIGGGNCQVSSTLYNSVLNISNLTILERHEHGKSVGYVPDGKDAAVAYGSLDFKFRNDTGYNIKIEAATNNESITIRLLQL